MQDACDAMEIEIIRSQKRKKTVSARVIDGKFVVRAPAAMSDAQLRPLIENLQHRWLRSQKKKELDNEALHQRAQELNRRYFDGELNWNSISWVTNQNKSRFGSCTPSEGTIRISHRIADMPPFVRDYVIVHELAHLVEANHGPRFWQLVNRYPKTERARGYLMAVGLETLDG